jgi:hypothetical protein
MARTKIAKLRVMKRKARQSSSAQQRIEIEVLVDQNSESPVQSLNFQRGSQSWLDQSPITMVSIDCLAAIIEAKAVAKPHTSFPLFRPRGFPSLSFLCMVIFLSSHYGSSFRPLCAGFYVRLKEHCKVDMSVGAKNPSSIQ